MHNPLGYLKLGAAFLAALSVVQGAASHQSLRLRLLVGSFFDVPGDNRTFDYVIAGGGNADLTISTRLVEQKTGTVAVVEAGTFYRS